MCVNNLPKVVTRKREAGSRTRDLRSPTRNHYVTVAKFVTGLHLLYIYNAVRPYHMHRGPMCMQARQSPTPQIAPSCGGPRPPSDTWLPETIRMSIAIGVWVELAAFVHGAHIRDHGRQTNPAPLHATPPVAFSCYTPACGHRRPLH